jgi:hypothetical protein
MQQMSSYDAPWSPSTSTFITTCASIVQGAQSSGKRSQKGKSAKTEPGTQAKKAPEAPGLMLL